MNIKPFGSIVVSVCLGWLVPSLALAQPVITTQPTNHFMNAPGGFFVYVNVTGTCPTNPLSALRLLAPSLTSTKVGQASRLPSSA